MKRRRESSGIENMKRRRESETEVTAITSTTSSVTSMPTTSSVTSMPTTSSVTSMPTTLSVTSMPQGGIQVGNHNICYNNCAITNITNNCKRCHRAEGHDVSGDTPRDLIPSSAVHTTTSVRFADRQGRELELGDVVLINRREKVCIYTGDGMIIRKDNEIGKIVLEAINVEEPLTSYPSKFLCTLFPKYNTRQVVQRAREKVDQRWDYGRFQFVLWCFTDKKWTSMLRIAKIFFD